MTKSDKATLEDLVIENNPQARITLELARQLTSHLPIESFDRITEQMGEVVIGQHRLSLAMFSPYVSNDLFPIHSVGDLVRKLSAGVQSALALGHSRSVPITNPSVRSILASTVQPEPGRRPATPIVFAGVGSSPNPPKKGGL